jgi:hypothetical protein
MPAERQTKSAAAKAKAKAKAKTTTTPRTRGASATSTPRAVPMSTRSATRPASSPQGAEDTDGSILASTVHNLAANAAEAQDAIQDLQDKFRKLEDNITQKIDSLTQALSTSLAGTRADPQASPSNGNNPRLLIQSHLPWIDQSLLANVIALKLDVKDLVRLLPVEDRPKGRSATLPNSLALDPKTGKWTATDDAPVSFDKDFPDFDTLLYVLSVYGTIRTTYDADGIGIGPAIFLYIKLLTRWVLIDKFQFGHIRAYFVAHFRKYQASTDPLDWINVDIQLFTAHIRPPPTSQQHSLNNRPAAKKPTREATVCNNWNTEGKGCTWEKCIRMHLCSNCGSKDHPTYRCTKKEGTRP